MRKKIGEKYPRKELVPGDMFCHEEGGRVLEAVSNDGTDTPCAGAEYVCRDSFDSVLWTWPDDMCIYMGRVRILPDGRKCTRGLMERPGFA